MTPPKNVQFVQVLVDGEQVAAGHAEHFNVGIRWFDDPELGQAGKLELAAELVPPKSAQAPALERDIVFVGLRGDLYVYEGFLERLMASNAVRSYGDTLFQLDRDDSGVEMLYRLDPVTKRRTEDTWVLERNKTARPNTVFARHVLHYTDPVDPQEGSQQ